MASGKIESHLRGCGRFWHLFCCPLSHVARGADEGAESAFFLPASNTIVITRSLGSRFVADMVRV
jgi:hypothetical protein